MKNPFKAFSALRTFLLLGLILGVLFAILFARGFEAGQAHFANDAPLGQQKSPDYYLPTGFFGMWSDMYWIGNYCGNYFPNFTCVLLWALGPFAFSKFCVPFTALTLGLCAAFFFRQLRLQPWVCIVGGMAAALNSNFLSNSCWGLPGRANCLAAIFLALAAVHSSFSGRALIKYLLAGVAIGFAITEGGDNGAIFSLFVAAYAFVLTLIQPGPMPGKIFKAVGSVAVMALLAGLVAVQTLNIFVQTAYKGISNIQNQTKEQRWDWATQWSLPKAESLRVIIPGLFGYRIDSDPPTPAGGEYWGTVGRDPTYEQTHRFPRHSGAGEYAGVFVVLVAIWALTEASRREGKAFSPQERNLIWFWGAAALISLLLSWGRHAPFYRLVYALPYFSTIRNPMKFMHVVHMALMILFAYGLQGLGRRYLEAAGWGGAAAQPAGKGGKQPVRAPVVALKAGDFERQWTWGCVIAIGLSLLGWIAYSLSQRDVVGYLTREGFEPARAALIAQHSVGEVGVFVLFLVLSAGLVLAIVRGAMTGPRARWAIVGMGLLVAVDLGRANTPWIKYYDYATKYAPTPLTEFLRQRPYEHRVAVIPPQLRVLRDQNQKVIPPTQELITMGQVYEVEWVQQQFPYYDIQALDMPQEPRMPAEKEAYLLALMSPITSIARLWELTNTRYLCGVMAYGYVDWMNAVLDPVKKRFRVHTAFDLKQGPLNTILVQTNQTGPYALIEFTGALPRARLFSQWQSSTNNQETLKTLGSAAFDPHRTVLVSDPIAPPPSGATNADAGTVECVSYAPKRIKFQAQAAAPAVLLLNDKYDAGWHATVDGKPVPVLRCNFLMRGVPVPAGNHVVQFTYQPSVTGLYYSLAGLGLGLLLCGVLILLDPLKNPDP
jgi:hypothetical protein